MFIYAASHYLKFKKKEKENLILDISANWLCKHAGSGGLLKE